MKFGKEFVSQMVPEWQEAYMNYNFLKGLLKDALRFRQQNMAAGGVAATPRSLLRRRASLYRAFSGLTSIYRASQKKNHEDEAILVSTAEGEGSEGHYQTLFLNSSDDGGEYELVYFRRLDEEFNKVVKFYKGKVEEVMKEAEELTKQMDAFIALRIKVENPLLGLGGGDGGGGSGPAGRRINHQDHGRKPGKEESEIVCSDFHVFFIFTFMFDWKFWIVCEGRAQMEAIQEVEMSGNNGKGKTNIEGFRPASLEVLKHVKINIEPETPVSTLKSILPASTSDMSFSKEELRKAEELMTKAFVEFHIKLRVLKSFW